MIIRHIGLRTMRRGKRTVRQSTMTSKFTLRPCYGTSINHFFPGCCQRPDWVPLYFCVCEHWAARCLWSEQKIHSLFTKRTSWPMAIDFLQNAERSIASASPGRPSFSTDSIGHTIDEKYFPGNKRHVSGLWCVMNVWIRARAMEKKARWTQFPISHLEI